MSKKQRLTPPIKTASSIAKPRRTGPRVLTKVKNKGQMNKLVKRFNKKLSY